MSIQQVYIGYDPREHDAYRVAQYSLESRATDPVLITPLHLDLVSHLIPAPIKRAGQMWDVDSDAPQSTEFARSRFCIPKLRRRGWALFMDCDMLILNDIGRLFALADDRYAVMVVKHDAAKQEQTGVQVKMDYQTQTYYERKNWSSVILWNCSHPAHLRLTEPRLNMWPGRDLHAFKWLQDDEIGELPAEWNHLVGIDSGAASILHFTLGIPGMPHAPASDFDDLWAREYAQVLSRRELSERRQQAVVY